MSSLPFEAKQAPDSLPAFVNRPRTHNTVSVSPCAARSAARRTPTAVISTKSAAGRASGQQISSSHGSAHLSMLKSSPRHFIGIPNMDPKPPIHSAASGIMRPACPPSRTSGHSTRCARACDSQAVRSGVGFGERLALWTGPLLQS